MKKINILNLLLSASIIILTVACGENESTNNEQKLQDVSFLSINLDDFNTKAKYAQRHGIGYEWRDSEELFTEFDEYSTTSGDDTLHFDEKGRLRHYMNIDGIPITKNGSDSKLDKTRPELTKEELVAKCEELLKNSVDNPEQYVLSEERSHLMEYVGSIYYPAYLFYNNVISPEITDGVIIMLNEYGDIKELQIGYNELKGIDLEPYEEYFQSSLDKFINEYKEKYDISDYEVSRFVNKLDNKVCAFYTVTFYQIMNGNADETAVFAEGAVFTQDIK